MLSFVYNSVKAAKKKLCLTLTQFRHSNTFLKHNRAIALPDASRGGQQRAYVRSPSVLYSPAN